MSRVRISHCLALAFFILASLPASGEEDPFQAVKEVVQHQDHMTFEGIKILAHLWDQSQSIQAVHVLKETSHERFEYLPFRSHPYQEIIVNGKSIYYIKPSKNLIVRAPFEYHGPKEDTILSLARQNYDWQDEGTENVAGFETHVISATPNGEKEPLARFWVDEEHHAILKEERYDAESHKPIFASWFSFVSFPHNLPDTFFQISGTAPIRYLPPPTELAGEKALKALDFKPLIPRYVPEGFALVGTYLIEWRPHGKLQFLYSDGLRDFSVYENLRRFAYHPLKESRIVSLNGHSVELLEQPEGRLIRFAQGQLTIAVVGSLPQKTMGRVALNTATPASLKSAPTGPVRQVAHYFVNGLRTLRHLLGFNY